MSLKEEIISLARQAKEAYYFLSQASSEEKNKALQEVVKSMERRREEILKANQQDVEEGRKKGLSKALIDRLTITEKRFESMVRGIREVVSLPDPVGEVIKMWRRPNGLLIGKMRVPIGVIGIIYESRPNVTSDAASLCLKSGNSVILRGGSEAFRSNQAIVEAWKEGLEGAGFPASCVQFVPTVEREAVNILLQLHEFIDLIIPRGGEGLIRKVTEISTIPVIKHYKGVCHVYVEEDADLEMAVRISFNAKVQRPGVCNAMETLLVHEKIASSFLPRIGEKLKNAGVEIRGCPRTKEILPYAVEAKEEDWYEEYLDLILAVKVVKNIDEAIKHINTYGSQHSDAIVTSSYSRALKFLREVDSACVYVNASTRFTDGGEFGMGAEIGISTDKLHARGPMGLEELTTYKFIIFGEGQIRE